MVPGLAPELEGESVESVGSLPGLPHPPPPTVGDPLCVLCRGWGWRTIALPGLLWLAGLPLLRGPLPPLLLPSASLSEVFRGRGLEGGWGTSTEACGE